MGGCTITGFLFAPFITHKTENFSGTNNILQVQNPETIPGIENGSQVTELKHVHPEKLFVRKMGREGIVGEGD